jgi:NADPH:quinone reductase-like Zn-dependent oxidoreductase
VQQLAMRTAVLTDYGHEPVVAEVARPELPVDSVIVAVHAAAINPIDWMVMEAT